MVAGALAGRHWSEKALGDMTERDWRIMREDFDIAIKGGRPLNPLRSWEETAGLAPEIRQAIEAMGYKEPSPIQRQALPMGLAGRDLIGVAETGSGKTAAFLIPLLSYILKAPAEMRARVGENGPLALVMAPTRELAQQIEEECKKLARFTSVRSLCVVGGTSIEEQSHRIQEGVEVIIGTPGRLIECINMSYLVLQQCAYIVLDEADRMIDLGFEPQVTQVLDSMGAALRPAEEGAAAGGAGGAAAGGGSGAMHVEGGAAGTAAASSSAPSSSTITAPSRWRTTHMFTATMPPEVEKLAKRFMSSPATVKIGEQSSAKNKRIAQEVIFIPGGEAKKRAKLMELLRTCPRPVIVFVNAKKQCDTVGRDIEHAGYTCTVLHSGKSQELREESLAEFKSGEVEVLVATDVAGRGLDIPDVAQVVNYDMPGDIDKYTHRIGRTGRAGKSGKATTFLTEEDAAIMPLLKAHLEASGQPVPGELASRASGEGARETVKYAKK